MIEINFFDNAIVVNGHANANVYGYDIYCAGVSAIVMGSLNWFKPQEIHHNIKDGFLELKLINNSLKNKQKLELIKIQLSALINDQSQKYIKIIDNQKRGHDE